ncbi:MAG: hypothetical protein ACFFB0_08370 [Promethearchaeota archaeon]
MIKKKARFFFYAIFFTILLTFLVKEVQGTKWTTTQEITLPANQKFSSSKSCYAGDKLEIDYNVKSGPGIDVYLMDSENGSNFMRGEDFTYIEFSSNSRGGSWSYKVTLEGSYGIYMDNINDEEVTIWFEITRIEPADAKSISSGFYFLIPVVFAIGLLIIIANRRK